MSAPTAPAVSVSRHRAGSLRQTLGHRWQMQRLRWRSALRRLTRPLLA